MPSGGTASVTRSSTLDRDEGRASAVRRQEGLHRRRLQPRRRRLAHAPADALDRGRGDGAAPQPQLGRASSSRSKTPTTAPVPGVDRAAPSTRSSSTWPRASGSTCSAGPSSSPPRGVPTRALAGAVRARRAPGRDRAAEADAGRGGSLRRLPQALAAALPAPDRPRHRQRRRRLPGRDHDDSDPLPARAGAGGGDVVQGPRAAAGIVEALQAVGREPGSSSPRGGGSTTSFPSATSESRRGLVPRACRLGSATSRTRRSAILAADVRASTPTAAGKLVVPDFEALRAE